MVSLRLEVEHYDLQTSLEPSFVSSLYENLEQGSWIKFAGSLRGIRIKQRGRILDVEYHGALERSELEKAVVLETGLWHEAFEEKISGAPRSFRPVLENLSSEYPGVRIPIAPHDFGHLFFAVLLSKRVDYRLVKKWSAAIWSKVGGDLERIVKIGVEMLEKITRSYHDAVKSVRSVIDLFGDLNKFCQEAITKPPEAARIMLLRIWGVGPKIADSIILSTFKASYFAPCDTHLVKLVKALDLARGFKLPKPDSCIKFACSKDPIAGLRPCPQYHVCLRGILSSSLGELAGWFQTLAYLHGRRYCRRIKPRCESCPLKSLCSAHR